MRFLLQVPNMHMYAPNTEVSRNKYKMFMYIFVIRTHMHTNYEGHFENMVSYC